MNYFKMSGPEGTRTNFSFFYFSNYGTKNLYVFNMVILRCLNIVGDQIAPRAFSGFSSPRGELPSSKFYGSAFYVCFFKNSCFL